jgi:hypothetical protein
VKTPPEVFDLKKESHKANCLTRILELKANDEKPYQVVIYTAKDIRTLKQNRLYWKHMGQIEKAGLGDLHMHLKRKYLHPIFMAGKTRANIKYQTNYRSLCIIKQSGNYVIDDYPDLFHGLLGKVLTTKDASTKQMAEYINAYWVDINGRGVYLSDPSTYMTGDSE